MGSGFATGKQATELHLVGDIFDFWFEYKRAVPKGGVRLMGAIAELTDGGLPIHFHAGNHDMWTFGYLEEELGVQVHRKPIVRTWDGLRCMVGHGDGLGPGDKGTCVLKASSPPLCAKKHSEVSTPTWALPLQKRGHATVDKKANNHSWRPPRSIWFNTAWTGCLRLTKKPLTSLCLGIATFL